MNFRINLLLLTVTLSILLSLRSVAQIVVSSKNSFEKIKDGTTYIVIDDMDFKQSGSFLEAFKKYWTITKGIEVTKRSDLTGKLKDGDSCFSMEVTFQTSGRASFIYYYINLWVPSEKSLKRNEKFDVDDEKSIGRIQLCVHSETGKRNGDLRVNFGNGYINNWTPALLKNYLLQLSMVLQSGQKFSDDDITNKNQLSLLKSATLYCPEDDFNTLSVTGINGKYDPTEITDLFNHYKFNYKIITNQELESRIAGDNNPFYYLLYIRGTENGKMVVVVNSRTGEIIYSRTKASFSHNLKSDEINGISNAIDRS